MPLRYDSDGIRSPDWPKRQEKNAGKSELLLFQRSKAARKNGGRHDASAGVMLANLQPLVEDIANRCWSASASLEPSSVGVSVLFPKASCNTHRRDRLATESTKSHSSMKISLDILDVLGNFSVGLSRTRYDSSPLSLLAHSS